MDKMKFYKVSPVICILFCIILMMSGCVENVTESISDIGDKASSLVDDGLNYIDSGFNGQDTDLIKAISNFPTLDNNTIDTFEGYQNFVDSVNALFKFLNREGGYNFQVLKGTREEYDKISKVITEYSPLIDNHNAVIYAAREYDKNNSESVKAFYKALGVFGLEFSIIYATVWYAPTYKTVGMVYRWSGLNRFAFKYPTLISFILSQAHWGLRGVLVDKSSEAAEYFFDGLNNLI